MGISMGGLHGRRTGGDRDASFGAELEVVVEGLTFAVGEFETS